MKIYAMDDQVKIWVVSSVLTTCYKLLRYDWIKSVLLQGSEKVRLAVIKVQTYNHLAIQQLITQHTEQSSIQNMMTTTYCHVNRNRPNNRKEATINLKPTGYYFTEIHGTHMQKKIFKLTLNKSKYCTGY